jgi:hypothetical protein
MTVIPLVVSSLVVGVTAAPDPAAVGRIGARALVIFVVVVSAASAAGVLLGAPALALFPLDPSAVEALRASAASAGRQRGRRGPQHPHRGAVDRLARPGESDRAAADGAMLPLIVFSVLFAAALMRVAAERKRTVVRFFEGVQDASLVLVRAILEFAPLGVFALAVPLAARMGIAAAGALVGYIVIVSGICVLFMALVLYPGGGGSRRVPLGVFARACLPAQGIAFSSRSSLAALPAMLESVQHTLKLPPAMANFFIPLARRCSAPAPGSGRPSACCSSPSSTAWTSARRSCWPSRHVGDHLVLRARHARRLDHRDGARADGGRHPRRGHRHPARRGHHPGHVPHHHQRDRAHVGGGDPQPRRAGRVIVGRPGSRLRWVLAIARDTVALPRLARLDATPPPATGRRAAGERDHPRAERGAQHRRCLRSVLATYLARARGDRRGRPLHRRHARWRRIAEDGAWRPSAVEPPRACA